MNWASEHIETDPGFSVILLSWWNVDLNVDGVRYQT
jgi:hypothetical protein